MGNFAIPTGKTSEGQFAISSGNRVASSKWGEKRNDGNKVNVTTPSYAASQAAASLEPVQPLKVSAN